MRRTLRRAFAAVTTLLVTACTNYDFARARTANGDYDVGKLMADLEESGKEQLTQGTWIPLLYADLTTFGKSDVEYPAGFTLQHLTAVGPVFCFGGATKTIYDPNGKTIEHDGQAWLLWGGLWNDRAETVETIAGRRYSDHYRYLLIGGDDSVLYFPPPEAGKAKAD